MKPILCQCKCWDRQARSRGQTLSGSEYILIWPGCVSFVC